MGHDHSMPISNSEPWPWWPDWITWPWDIVHVLTHHHIADCIVYLQNTTLTAKGCGDHLPSIIVTLILGLAYHRVWLLTQSPWIYDIKQSLRALHLYTLPYINGNCANSVNVTYSTWFVPGHLTTILSLATVIHKHNNIMQTKMFVIWPEMSSPGQKCLPTQKLNVQCSGTTMSTALNVGSTLNFSKLK